MPIELRQDAWTRVLSLLKRIAPLPDGAERALAGLKGPLTLEDAVQRFGVPRERLLQGVASLVDWPFANLLELGPSPEAIVAVNEAVARKYRCVPLFLNGDELTVGLADPRSWGELDELADALSAYQLVYVLVDEVLLNPLLDMLYPSAALSAVERFLNVTGKIADQDATLRRAGEAAPVIDMVDTILERSKLLGASDIHIEPFKHHSQVRVRVDGRMQTLFSFDPRLQEALIARIKILANLNTIERIKPQDGRFTRVLRNLTVEARVSTLRMIEGEKAVIRIMRGEMATVVPLEELGMPSNVLESVLQLINQPYGMFLVTGPTGSGKTSTLYAALQHLNTGDRNLISLEDPVEYALAGVNQVPMRPEHDLSFATALRSVLRQDPDVIMVGEVRDLETAEIAIRGALTGHLLLATLHTNDAIETVTRMLEMGVKGGNLAPSLLGVLSQRLVRKLCRCHTYAPVSPERLRSLGLGFLPPETPFPVKVGCAACGHEGYTGRLVLFELLRADEEIRRLILDGASSGRLAQQARSAGMQPLFTAGLREVLAGRTTLEEVLRTVSHTGQGGSWQG